MRMPIRKGTLFTLKKDYEPTPKYPDGPTRTETAFRVKSRSGGMFLIEQIDTDENVIDFCKKSQSWLRENCYMSEAPNFGYGFRPMLKDDYDLERIAHNRMKEIEEERAHAKAISNFRNLKNMLSAVSQ